MLFYGYHLYGLSFTLVHGVPLVFHFAKIDAFKVDATDMIIVCCLVVYFSVGEIYGRCPLCGTRDIRSLALLVFYSDRDVKVVEQMEAPY